MSKKHHHPHDAHAAITHDEKPGFYEILEISIRELLVEKGLLGPAEIREQIEVLDSRSPALGSMLVARAWLDPAFKQRLLDNGVAAAKEMGIDMYDDTDFSVVENTETVHHVIVCTLCSCYPRPVLGLPPDWYKSKEYRSRTVKEPRAVLEEFGTIIPAHVDIVVKDSTANLRYMVLPLRPAGTENYTESQLAALVTRDAMIGVKVLRA
ncbi:MAG TPA: nitrile hydratase subunit alpha [Chitinophagaceae bacterium]|nr:nitrile hydratase subunit alpha [Chitinophagaceae bacterium]